jgi:hypothetical protein
MPLPLGPVQESFQATIPTPSKRITYRMSPNSGINLPRHSVVRPTRSVWRMYKTSSRNISLSLGKAFWSSGSSMLLIAYCSTHSSLPLRHIVREHLKKCLSATESQIDWLLQLEN